MFTVTVETKMAIDGNPQEYIEMCLEIIRIIRKEIAKD